MKPSGPLSRKTPLTSSTPLKRTTALSMSPSARSVRHGNDARQKHQPKRKVAKNTGPTAAVRRLVAARSGGWCEWPACLLVATDTHHRLNRKNGGRHGEAAARLNQAAWLLHTCRPHHEAVTSPFGAARVQAREMGWLLHEGQDARCVPVVSRHGHIWLADDGSFRSDLAEEAA